MTKIISIVGGMQPSAPTIGTATAGDTTASVAFTPSTYIGKGTITYTATSSPGGFTGTGSSSPITVSGLTNGTAYTFTVVGTTNYGVASVASAASNSITPAASFAYESIATYVLTSPLNTITFSSIPQTFKHLQIRVFAIWTYPNTDYTNLVVTTNAASDYSYHSIVGTGSSTSTGGNNSGALGYIQTFIPSNRANTFGMGILDILDYKNTSINKVVRGIGGTDNNGAGYATFASSLGVGTSAITSISIKGDSPGHAWGEYSHFALYGIKG